MVDQLTFFYTYYQAPGIDQILGGHSIGSFTPTAKLPLVSFHGVAQRRPWNRESPKRVCDSVRILTLHFNFSSVHKHPASKVSGLLSSSESIPEPGCPRSHGQAVG